MVYRKKFTRVSTRSRPKAADKKLTSRNKTETVSTRSRPKAADASKPHLPRQPKVSTRSRPKAAESGALKDFFETVVSTRSRPKAAESIDVAFKHLALFQLAAARRRLMPPLKPLTGKAYITLFR